MAALNMVAGHTLVTDILVQMTAMERGWQNVGNVPTLTFFFHGSG